MAISHFSITNVKLRPEFTPDALAEKYLEG